METVGGVAAVAERITEQQIRAFGGSVDAASIVFMHSALDGALHDLCRITALVAPKEWQQFVESQEERLGVIRDPGYDAVARERVDTFVAALSQESLLKKTDRLFQVCRPDRAYSRAGYQFDRGQLAELDEIRHSIANLPERRNGR